MGTPFSTHDYYSHDLYMDMQGGTFLNPANTRIISSTLPGVEIYVQETDNTYARVGWVTYQPTAIYADTVYTVTLRSANTTQIPLDPEDYANLVETLGWKFNSECTADCFGIPLSWCKFNAGSRTIPLFDNTNDPNHDGVFIIGQPLGLCNGLPAGVTFLPMITR